MTQEQGNLFEDIPVTGKPKKGKSKKDRPRKSTGAQPTWSPAHGDAPAGPLQELVDSNFLEYASYVIRDRAIPDEADGLKPVQRRILHALKEKDDGKFIKVANVVGHTMQYHPHGDASIGDALVNLANKRYLIEGQGNFGNLFTGDVAAAPRYIECRLTPMAREHIYCEELTEFVPSYDGRNKEPVKLPCKLPLLLMLGTEGIAVGLSTRILPHNFTELINAAILALDKKPFEIYPDFIQGGRMDVSEYEKGNGRVRVRAIIEKNEKKRRLIIKDIPFGTTTESLIASVEDAAKKKKIKLRSIQDYTAEKIEIELKLAPDADLDRTIQALFAFTQCEVSISVQCIVIRDRRPVETNVEDLVRAYTKRLVEQLKDELRLQEKNLSEDLQRKSLVRLFVEERIYKAIEECTTQETVVQAVFDGLAPFRKQLVRDVTNKDVEMLLGIPIRRISRFDIEKNRKDCERIVAEIEQVRKYLARPKSYTKRYLQKLLKDFSKPYDRRTEITSFQMVEIKHLTRKEHELKYDKTRGYLGYDVEGEDALVCTNHDRVVMVWSDGRYQVMSPPEKQWVDRNLLHISIHDRDREHLVIYRYHEITYIKKFAFGGYILNRDYQLAPVGSEILYFTDQIPERLYVKYRKAKRQRIDRQMFDLRHLLNKGVKAKGAQLTVKKIRTFSETEPRGWNDGNNPPGAVMDL